MKEQVWNNGTIVEGHDPAIWRKDDCGAWIKFAEYSNRKSQFGWEIDHISPGGMTVLSNLRPLQWKNNLEKSDGHLKCSVLAKSGQEPHLNAEHE